MMCPPSNAICVYQIQSSSGTVDVILNRHPGLASQSYTGAGNSAFEPQRGLDNRPPARAPDAVSFLRRRRLRGRWLQQLPVLAAQALANHQLACSSRASRLPAPRALWRVEIAASLALHPNLQSSGGGSLNDDWPRNERREDVGQNHACPLHTCLVV